MKISVLTANFGGFDSPQTHAIEVYNCPEMFPRLCVNPRMQSKYPKMLGWKYVSDADIIIWIDGSYKIISPDFTKCMVDSLGEADLCLMHHNERNDIKSEAVESSHPYYASKYAGEPMMEQVTSYLMDKTFNDDWLAAAGCFIYRVNCKMKEVMTDWFLECFKWSCQDQLSLPYVLHKHNIKPNWLNYKVYEINPYIEFVGHK